MATVTVTQPARGSISTLSSAMAAYTVRWNDGGSGATFWGFRVICHACERTLYNSSSNPATFDLSNLESSGHPGPFEIVADVGNPPHELYVLTHAVGHGTTTPAAKWYGPVADGGTVRIEMDATPDEGYRFVEWRKGSSSGSVVGRRGETHYSVAVTLTGDWQTATEDYYAIFEDASLVPVRGLVGDVPDHDPLQIGKKRYHVTKDSSATEQILRTAVYHGTTYESDKIKLAKLTTSPAYKGTQTGVVYPGQTLTINFTVLSQYYASFGLCVDRVEVKETSNKWLSGQSTETFVYSGGSGSLTIRHTVSPDIAGGTEHSLIEVTVYLVTTQNNRYRRVTFTVVGDMHARPFLRTRRGANAGMVYAAAGEYTVSMLVPTWAYHSDTSLDYGVEFGGYLVREGAFVHGWSIPVLSSSGTRYIVIYNSDSGDVNVIVYICTHLLVCLDSGWALVHAAPSLIYDCSVPTGTTVYS